MVNSKLADACEIVMGQSPAGEMCNASGVGLPLLNGPTEYGAHHPTPVQFTTDARKRAKEGDLLFCVRGSTTGRMNWADREYAIGRGLAAIRHKSYRELQPLVRAVIENNLPSLLMQATGSTFPNVSSRQLLGLPWPNLDTYQQRAIAHILGTLDERIELNHRRNQTLEAVAIALFKDWFVDFGPVRAKMEGCEPYLPIDTWQLFPDRLDDEGKPEGWQMVPTSELIEFNPTEPLRKGTPAPYLDMASLPTSGSWPEAPIMREFGGGMRFRNGDTLLARITPCLENGKTAFVQCLPEDTVGWGSTEYIVMRPKAPVPAGYAYLLARDDVFRGHAIRSMTGTSGRQRVQGDSIANFKLASPPDKDLWQEFERQISSTFESIKSNAKASETLSELRETLLPKLISGELCVPDAETFVKEHC
jgi:type I restriction enzyme S subunit